ncbi:MAG: dihydrolipoyllysine-residue acetyltransferase [Gammaproteobacteria bacterium]|jgi:pyruvate dehydrogenase E2 component (dihydrolipoamide acetyltransferase)|nr:dihydrolipoyllysine-residue acetyltransferase [Gammaproteobacteria bacterium]
MANINVTIPDLGGANDVEVIELCVAVGDTVAEGDSLIVLETDKASMEIPSPHTGVVAAIHLQEGATCNVGDALLDLTAEGEENVAPEVDQGVDEQPSDTAQDSVPEPMEEVAVASVSQTLEMLVPDLGGASEVEVIEVAVAEGDEIAEGDTIVVVETDKASMEIPATSSGKLVSLKLSEGSKVNQGDLMALVESVGSADASQSTEPAPAPVASVEAIPAAPVTPPVAPQVAPMQAPVAEPSRDQQGKIHAGPAVRMLARELGADLTQVSGTGPKGRILKEDVHAFVKQRLNAPVASAAAAGSVIAQPPAIDFSQFGEVEKIKMSKIHRLTAQNMTRSWLNVPHVTQFDHADITELEAFRKGIKAEAEQRGTKVTPLPFMLKACAMALREFPQFNVSLDNDGEHLIQKHYVNIGVAVDTPAGLVVPVLRDVDQKSIWQLSEEIIEMGGKAKNKKLMPADMQGGCFTISSLGSIGGTAFTPIVNTPEVAILGVSKADIQPRWDGSEFKPRLMMPLSLSYDHRAINGADAARFTAYLGKVLSDIRHLVM